MALSLNGVDPSCMNSITGSSCRAKYSNISHDRMIKNVYNIGLKYKYITLKITNLLAYKVSFFRCFGFLNFFLRQSIVECFVTIGPFSA